MRSALDTWDHLVKILRQDFKSQDLIGGRVKWRRVRSKAGEGSSIERDGAEERKISKEERKERDRS